MVNDEEDSVFVKYQGKNVNLAPLLGEGYNRWLPMMIAIIAGVTLVNLHGKIMRLFKIKNYFYETIASNDADTEEGRTIIEQERSIEERKQNRGTYAYSSHGLNVSSNGSRGAGAGARSQTAKDYLAKYRSGAGGAGGGWSSSPSNDGESLLNSRPSMSSDTSEEGGGGNVGSMLGRGMSNLFKPSSSSGGVASSRPIGGSRVSGGGAGQGRFSRFEDVERGAPAAGKQASSARSSSPPRGGRKFGVGAGTSAATNSSGQSATGSKGSVLSPPQNPAGTVALGFSGGGGGRGSGAGSSATGTPKTKPKPPPTNVFGEL